MKYPVWKPILIVLVLGLFLALLYPPSEKLKPGLDLAGGTTLVYDVKVPPELNASQVIDQTIEILRDRVDVTGTKNLLWRQIAGNRIEIQMPLAPPETQRLREAYLSSREALLAGSLDEAHVEEAVARPADERAAAFDRIAGDNEQLRAQLDVLAQTYDAWVAATGPYQEAQQQHREAEQALAELSADASESARSQFQGDVDRLLAALIERTEQFIQARDAYRAELKDVLANRISAGELERILNLTNQLKGKSTVSERAAAIEQLKRDHPDRAADIDRVAAAYADYEQVRGRLDDPNDLIALLRGSGILEFRIAAQPNTLSDEQLYREQLAEQGPRAGQDQPWRWIGVDDIAEFIAEKSHLSALEIDPATYFRTQMGLVGDNYADKYYILLANTPNLSITRAQEDWEISSIRPDRDSQGFPAISFRLNAVGSQLMQAMTRPNVGRQLSIVLDGKVKNSARIRDVLSSSVLISGGEGGFSRSELDYLLRTLRAGSLEGELGEYPISIKTTGPQLGQDNLRHGLEACYTALIVVAVFMLLYYFFAGAVADFALVANMIIILGVMAMIQATWTLPGIAGIVLTIGMAVDANVLIFERIREELDQDADVKTAVRLGYQKALSTIIDANLTTLLTCLVLGYTASAEVKGFAVTLGIGICATLFTALFCTHVIVDLWLTYARPKRFPMLPSTVPAINRALSPTVNWIGKRRLFFAFSFVLIVAGVFSVYERGQDMLDIEFRSGTQVSFDLAGDGAMPIVEVRERIREYGEVAERAQAAGFDPATLDDEQREMYDKLAPILREAQKRHDEALNEYEQEVNAGLRPDKPEPQADFSLLRHATIVTEGETSIDEDKQTVAGGFSISTLITDSQAVSAVVKAAFDDVLDTTRPIEFRLRDADRVGAAPIHIVDKANLGQVINQPLVDEDVGDYLGGVVIVLSDMDPAPTLEDLDQRIGRMRLQPAYEQLGFRQYMLAPIGEPAFVDEAGNRHYSEVAVVSHDAVTNYKQNPTTFEQRDGLADSEWRLVHDALRRDTSLASVSNFSGQVSVTMQQRAIAALALALLAVVIYIWLRFGNIRYGLAAIAALVHDVTITLGVLALAGMLYGRVGATFLMLEPFKINLAMVAAMLTIVGYSLNDTIVVFDRIRENRGRLAHATPEIINDSINQTISRTVLTSGTTMLALLVLYVLGGSAIHGFAFAMIIGIMIGTYSSIAIASPLLLIGSGSGAAGAQAGDKKTDVVAPKGKGGDLPHAAAVTTGR